MIDKGKRKKKEEGKIYILFPFLSERVAGVDEHRRVRRKESVFTQLEKGIGNDNGNRRGA